jgi:hypothetical protein
VRGPLRLVLEQAHGGDGVGRVNSEAVVYTIKYELLPFGKAGHPVADPNLPRW